MTKIYIVSMSTTQGPYGPTVNMSYHKTREKSEVSFKECVDSVGDDPSTILLIEIDGEMMTEKILDSFEGTGEEFDGY